MTSAARSISETGGNSIALNGSAGPSPDALARAVRSGDRVALARAISLVESTSPRHAAAAGELLSLLAPSTGAAVRVGVTGVPGAGKSTLIEQLGLLLCAAGGRVAVLAIDPTSAISGGSVLGDRTRMRRLAADERAFIRPSPSGGTLGGVARRTREAALLCEAAGFGVILIETVGVGQSETLVADMVDCVLSLAVAGTGDELQGIKRGLLESVDVLAVNKADGENLARARAAASDLASAMRVLRYGGADRPPVLTCSALTGAGVPEVWAEVEKRIEAARADGRLAARRQEQSLRWLRALIEDRILHELRASDAAARELAEAEERVRASATTPRDAADRVVRAFFGELRAGRQPTEGRP